MTSAPPRSGLAFATLALALSGACVFAAAQVGVPAVTIDAPLKPPPSNGTALKLGQRFERMLDERFPGLLSQDREGMAVVVVLLNDDWSIAKAAEISSRDDLPVTESTFGALGLSKEDVPYVGVIGMQAPDNPAHKLLIAYTEHSTPGKRFVSHVFPDTRADDRAIFRRYFPEAVKQGVPSGSSPWVLLDRDGRVLRTGVEPIDSRSWNRTLEQRFAGIKKEGITVTPITDVDGKPVADKSGKDVQLHSVWLAADSPPPAN